MDQALLDNLNKGEKLVEMTEYKSHGKLVYCVTVYICYDISFFGKRKIKEYTYPFYFISKAFAEEFLKYWGEFDIVQTTYWDHENIKDIDCYALVLNEDEYILVDTYKGSISSYKNKAQLGDWGIWAGDVVAYEYGRYSTDSLWRINYKTIFDIEDIGRSTNKSYIFKMVETE